MNVGKYIKHLRTTKGYSQEELGNLLGVKRAAVQKWECGKVQNLKRTTIQKLSSIFDVSPASFIDDSVDYGFGYGCGLAVGSGFGNGTGSGAPINHLRNDILNRPEISDDEQRNNIEIDLYNEIKELTNEQKQEILDFVRFKKQQEK